MDDGWPSSRPYVIGSLLAWAFFLFSIWLLTKGSGDAQWPAPLLWGLALVLAASVAGHFAAAYRLIARQDEFLRAITAKRIIAAAGATITVAVFAGVAVQFLGAPEFPLWVVYPFFWGMFGMVTPFIRSSLP